jgi:hypothetical protein
MLGHLADVLGIVAETEDRAVDARVESLDAAIEHLGGAGVILDGGDRKAGLFEGALGAARGQYLHAEVDETSGEVNEAGFV